MADYAHIQNGVVQEIREFDSIEGRFHPSLTWVEVNESVELYDRYDTESGEFSPRPQAVVELGTDNKVLDVRRNPRERLEDEDGWVVASPPPETPDDVVQAYDPQADAWSILFPKLSEAKAQRIQEINDRAYEVLSGTDWYIVRKQETGKAVPQDVLDHRADVRSKSDTFKSDVNALESASEVQEFSFDYPEPPEP